MVYYAYRRALRVVERTAGEDADWPSVYMARLDTDTGVFQLIGDQGQPVAPPVDWTHSNRRTTSYEDLRSWVNQYPTLWSLNPKDAFWFDPELVVDEGL